MRLRTKLFLILFIFVTVYGTVSAQDSTATRDLSWKRKGFIDAGVYIANPDSKSFVSQAFDVKPGFQLAFSGYLYPRLLFGARYTRFSGAMTNRQIAGDYDRTNFTTFGVELGYEVMNLNRFQFVLQAGAAATTYRNKKAGAQNFVDNGGSLFLNPQINLKLKDWLAVYLMPEWRIDYLNTEVPPELEDSFKKINYLNLSVGLQLRL